MKEFSNVQLQVIKSIEKSIAADESKLQKVNKQFERKLKKLENAIEDLKGQYLANKELLELSIHRANQSLSEYTGGLELKDIQQLSDNKEEFIEIDSAEEDEREFWDDIFNKKHNY